jgi:hypothetical protein
MSNIKGSSFYLQWVAAVSVALLIGIFAAFMSMWSVAEVIEQAIGETAAALVAGGLFGAFIGAGAGVGQAIALRNQGLPLGQWVGRSIISGAVSMAVTMTLAFSLTDMDTMPEVVAGLMIGLSVGLPISLVQWQLLKRHVGTAALWIPVSTAAYTIGFAAGLPLGGEDTGWLALGTTAIVTAVITGAGMLMLVRGEETAVTA